MLPSQVLKSGTSLDIQISNFAMQYENYLNEKAQNKASGKQPLTPKLNEQQMLDMLNQVRSQQ
jgi:hypothetical protein